MIIENFHIVEQNILQHCLKAGRINEKIKLIAVSKNQSIKKIEEAIRAGIKDFGENKAQEFKDKCSVIRGDLNWHFIGHLQTNKVKYIIESAEYIHSVDSIKIAVEINKRAEQINKLQKILIEINTGGEDSKFGIKNYEELEKLSEYIVSLPNLIFSGLMTMAPFTSDTKLIRKCFSKLRDYKDKLNSIGYKLEELSMGMTNDYEIAIEEGSTMLRIGTAIFGQRD